MRVVVSCNIGSNRYYGILKISIKKREKTRVVELSHAPCVDFNGQLQLIRISGYSHLFSLLDDAMGRYRSERNGSLFSFPFHPRPRRPRRPRNSVAAPFHLRALHCARGHREKDAARGSFLFPLFFSDSCFKNAFVIVRLFYSCPDY